MSNSDIVSAINTLIVAYQYKAGSVDWRLVGQELGIDKDCARMRVQRLLKKWPNTDLDLVEDKLMHSKFAKLAGGSPPSSAHGTRRASPPGGISKSVQAGSRRMSTGSAHLHPVQSSSAAAAGARIFSAASELPYHDSSKIESARSYVSGPPSQPYVNSRENASNSIPRILTSEENYRQPQIDSNQDYYKPNNSEMRHQYDRESIRREHDDESHRRLRYLEQAVACTLSPSSQQPNQVVPVDADAAEGAMMLEKMKIDTILV